MVIRSARSGLAAALLACLFLWGMQHDVQAGVLVWPARLELPLPPDGILPPIFVENRGSAPLSVHVSTGWGFHDLTGRPIYAPATEADAIRLHVVPVSFALGPGERQVLSLRVDAVDRALYPVVFVELHDAAGGHSAVPRVAVPILLGLEGAAPAGHIESFWLAETTGSQLAFNAIVSNRGQSHFRTQATVQVFGDGQEVTAIDLPEAVVLPGARRHVQVVWDAASLPPGDYTLQLATPHTLDTDQRIRFAVNQDRSIEVHTETPALLALGDVRP